MAPIEDLHSRDLAWISDFVVQQVVIMLRPMLEHLQQTDAAVDHAQRVLQRLGVEVSDVKGDTERISRSVAILRQGLGVQGEGRCVLQRGLEGAVRSVKRLDDQAEGLLGVLRGLEEGLGQQHLEARALGARQDDLAKQAAASASALEDLRAQAERAAADARAARDGLLDSEARLEGCQRELRELRRGALGLAPKLEEKAARGPAAAAQPGGRAAAAEPWPPKRLPFAPAEVGAAALPGPAEAAGGQQPKRASRGGASGRGPQPEHLDLALPPRSSSRATAWGGEAEPDEASILAGDEPAAGSRLPTLAAKQPGASRAPDRGSAEAPRLRFSATMANPPPSRGSPR